MRVFVFILVAANLVFLAWTQGYLGERASPDAIRLQQQLEADKLRVLSRDEPPAPKVPEKKAEKVEKPEKAAPVEKCLAWTALAEADTGRLDALLADKFSGLRRERHVVPEMSSWWVFIPPLANKALADRKQLELKQRGVADSELILADGADKLAISLGMFNTEEEAAARLEALTKRGVRSAIVQARTRPADKAQMEARGPQDALLKQIPELLNGLGLSNTSIEDCPNEK